MFYMALCSYIAIYISHHLDKASQLNLSSLPSTALRSSLVRLPLKLLLYAGSLEDPALIEEPVKE